MTDYEPDRIWSSLRREHDIKSDEFATEEAFLAFAKDKINRDKYLKNLGDEGRKQLMETARADFGAIPATQRETNLFTMRARGIISKDDFDIWSGQMGLTHGAADYRYRKFLRSDEMVWELHHKKLLERGEYSKLLRSRGLTYGQGYYRSRKYLAVTYGKPFRKWHIQGLG